MTQPAEVLTDSPLICPKCGHVGVTVAHLKASTACADAVRRLWGIYSHAQRKRISSAGGRPPEYVVCQECGQRLTKTAARRHRCQQKP